MVCSLASQAQESIETQLALERSKPSLTEEERHYFFHKAIRIVHGKGSTVWLPRYYIIKLFVFCSFEHCVQHRWKRECDSPFALLGLIRSIRARLYRRRSGKVMIVMLYCSLMMNRWFVFGLLSRMALSSDSCSNRRLSLVLRMPPSRAIQ